MNYAVELEDGTVLITTTAPKSITFDEKERRIVYFERESHERYKLTFVGDEGQYQTIYAAPEEITFHSPDKGFELYYEKSPPVTEVIEIPPDDPLLNDRYFRNAYAIQEGKLTVDMPKARNVHRDHMRAARKPKLEQADVDYFKAVEVAAADGATEQDKAEVQGILDHKQELRDVPQDPAIDAAQTPEELKAIWPEVLN